MIRVKYVLIKVTKNLLKQHVDMLYVMTVFNSQLKIMIYLNVQFVEEKNGTNIIIMLIMIVHLNFDNNIVINILCDFINYFDF